jgi:putative membrane protein
MSNRLLSALAVIAVLGLASCGGPPSTLNFIRKAEMSSLCEIEAGKIAIEKGHSAAVKQFGQQMVEAHSKERDALERIVKAEKLDVKAES